jgi:hypothetical protein
MNNMKIRSGARLNFTVERASDDAVSATFTAEHEDGAIITATVTYTAGVADFQFDSPDTDLIGTYEYQIAENFEEGSPDIYPSAEGCDEGDCEFPTLEICESLGEGSS